MAEALKAGKPVGKVALAKVEKVIMDGTMPKHAYYMVHWGSSVTVTVVLGDLNSGTDHPSFRKLLNAGFKDAALCEAMDQVQNFYPSPLANSTTMYYTGKNPLGKIGYKSEDVVVPKGDKQRRLHKALLRYHDPANWPLIRQALEDMGKKHLIGGRRECLVPAPTLEEMREARRQNRHTRPALTKHTPVAHQRQTPAANKKR